MTPTSTAAANNGTNQESKKPEQKKAPGEGGVKPTEESKVTNRSKQTRRQPTGGPNPGKPKPEWKVKSWGKGFPFLCVVEKEKRQLEAQIEFFPFCIESFRHFTTTPSTFFCIQEVLIK
jgi:hypothetical protein